MESQRDLSQSFVVRWNNQEGGISEGPLNVLWTLIESYKVDIFDVSLSRITKDFIHFLKLAETVSLELSAEYALMASHLVYWKSKSLLPDPGFEEEEYEPPLPRELVERLLEHKKFQLTAEKLSDLDKIASGVFTRPSNQVIAEDEEAWLDVSLVQLVAAFNEILEKQKDPEPLPDIFTNPHLFSVEEKMEFIQGLIEKKGEIHFSEIFENENPEKAEIVATFLALLELVKNRILKVLQHKMFGEMKILAVS